MDGKQVRLADFAVSAASVETYLTFDFEVADKTISLDEWIAKGDLPSGAELWAVGYASPGDEADPEAEPYFERELGAVSSLTTASSWDYYDSPGDTWFPGGSGVTGTLNVGEFEWRLLQKGTVFLEARTSEGDPLLRGQLEVDFDGDGLSDRLEVSPADPARASDPYDRRR